MKPARANGTRWVDHKLQALAKMERNWCTIVQHLEDYTNDHANSTNDKAKATGILRVLKQYKFVQLMHGMQDVLSEVAKLSLVLQRNDVTAKRSGEGGKYSAHADQPHGCES